MEPFLAAAREASRHVLDESPLPDGVTPDAFESARRSLSKALAEAAVFGLPPSVVARAAEAARSAVLSAREAAIAALAAAHNDVRAGAGDEEYEGPRLLPLHASVLTFLVNKLRSDR